MKKILSLFGALLVLTGLQAQTTQVKKETTAPKPVELKKGNSAPAKATEKVFKGGK